MNAAGGGLGVAQRDLAHGSPTPDAPSAGDGRPGLDLRSVGARRDPEPADLDAAVAAARRGDQHALTLLFRTLHPRLLRFLTAQERAVAEDLAAETWLAVTRGFPSFQGDAEAFRSWLFAIARRRLADHRRRRLRRRTDPADPATLDRATTAAGPADSAIAALTGQAAADLIVATLPPDAAEVVLLRVVGDLDVAAVAEILGRTPNWVRVTQHRALRRLVERAGTRIEVVR